MRGDMSKLVVLLAALLAVFGFEHGRASPPIEAYGALPEIRSMTLSPDGEHTAYLYYKDGAGALIVYSFKEGIVGGARTDKIKARSVSFAGSDHVILKASETTKVFGYRGRFEFSAAFSYGLETKKVKQLLQRTEDLHPAQSGLGRIVGTSPDGKFVFMPGFSGDGEHAPYSLFKVHLDSGRGRIVSRGLPNVIDWFVDDEGAPFVREEFSNKRNKYKITFKDAGGWDVLLEEESSRPPYSLMGVKADGSALVLVTEFADEEFSAVYELNYDGKISRSLFRREDAGIHSILSNTQRQVFGVEYTGFYPTYEFFDEELNQALKDVQDYFSGVSTSLLSWSDDFNKLLLYVEGSQFAGHYYLFDREAYSAKFIASSRPQIKSEDIGEVLTIEYKARDGLAIPALLTLPVGTSEGAAPLIVMPHGGPEAYDAVGFDWMAQYFANRGYMVFQPNFRGSDGFGAEFRDAGRGEWGGKMQDDVTDGVRALIKSGRADPERVCIIGASYGGYAALAGGAFTPDIYKCVAAIAPVADLPMMLANEKRDYGSRHWVYDYWKELIGDPRAEKEKLRAISPANYAEAFQAPVLLIHGKDDLVVPIRQSARMESALKRANKQVEFVRLKGEDHDLSTAETRLETLKALDAFVEEHIGVSKANTSSGASE